MSGVPYLIPDRALELNLSILLLVIKYLGETGRGKQLINNDKAHAFLYLVKNPVFLNYVLQEFGKRQVNLNDAESFSISSISPDFDPLFDHEDLKSLLVILASKNCIKVTYRSKEGFFYTLSSDGHEIASKLKGEYFDLVSKYLERLKEIQSESAGKLNQVINLILRRESL